MTKQFKISAFLSLVMLIVFLNYTYGQEYMNSTDNYEQNSDAKLVFGKIENGIAEGSVKQIIGYFSSQTYLSLSNGINGYYSSNQAYYVLEDYFGEYQASGFKFNEIKTDNENMYGTGTYSFAVRGKRSEAQVYISLKLTGKKWKITQLTIN